MLEARSLDDLFARHDSEPQAVGAALREIESVTGNDVIRFTWLVNHVVGEIQSAWSDAFTIMLRAVPKDAPVPALVNFAACAYLAGAPVTAMALEAKISEALSSHDGNAKCLIQLAVLQFAANAADPSDFVWALSTCLAFLRSATLPETVLKMFASSLNNVTSLLLDHHQVDHQAEPIRSLLLEASERCRQLWRKVGTWVNHERADYLVALCANKVGEWELARSAAIDGLATIDSTGPENVDRAFILLELARAERGFGRTDRFKVAHSQAFELAAEFDPDLRKWFDSRAVEF